MYPNQTKNSTTAYN